MNRALRVGLTGGVASGKSTVAALFAHRGVPVFSADAVAHELTQPDGPALNPIRAAFGDTVFHDSGALDRAALAARVFGDAGARRRLEALLHPPIIAELTALAAAARAPYCMIEIPLLKSHHIGPLVDRVLVVDLPVDAQRQRLRERDGLDDDAIDARIDAQMPRDDRLDLADDVIDNSGPADALEKQVDVMHALYMQLAARGEWAP